MTALTNKILLSLTILMLLGLLLITKKESSYRILKPETITEIVPKVAQQPLSEIGSDANIEIQELIKVVYALERYKLDHQSYPVSSSKGQRWDGLFSAYGESRQDWIKGLAPKYIPALPRDPRMLSDGRRQYIYKSNGANYKLVVHGAFNCKIVKDTYPLLVDPVRDCYSYGFWTPRARRW